MLGVGSATSAQPHSTKNYAPSYPPKGKLQGFTNTSVQWQASPWESGLSDHRLRWATHTPAPGKYEAYSGSRGKYIRLPHDDHDYGIGLEWVVGGNQTHKPILPRLPLIWYHLYRYLVTLGSIQNELIFRLLLKITVDRITISDTWVFAADSVGVPNN